jgi:tRNA U34 5-carboxymethylaminomethyl modifying GTPase MnmE/TrmE
VCRVRHRLLLEEAMSELRNYVAVAQEPEVATEHLRRALRGLAALSGSAHSVERLLDLVMTEFCIGK